MNDLLQKLEAAIKAAELLALRASTRRAGSDYRGVALNVEHDGPYDHGLPGEEWIGVFGQILEPVGIHAVNARDSLVATVGHPDVARHIVHNDPKRVLRRVARDREVLARHRPESIRLPGEPASRLRCFSCRADGPFLSDSDVSAGGAARARYDRLAVPAPWPCDDVRDMAGDYEIEVES